MKTRLSLLALLICFSALMSACTAAAEVPVVVSLPTPIPIPAGTEKNTLVVEDQPVAQPAEQAAPTQFPASETSPALLVVKDYIAAFQAGDYAGAAKLISSFSLTVPGLTRSSVEDDLKARAGSWSGFQVGEAQVFNEKNVLVHVTYQEMLKDAKTGEEKITAKDELWPVRLDAGIWRLNYQNLIDFHVLDVGEKTTAGLTVKPVQMTRYSDRIRLTLLVQNQTNEPIVLGQVNEILSTFFFGDQKIEGEKKQLIFDRLRTYPEITLEVKGLYTQYPDAIEIRRWKNLKVAPWFTFKLEQ